MKVVPEPISTLPVTWMELAAVAELVPEVVKLPLTVNNVFGIVLVPLPLRTRWP